MKMMLNKPLAVVVFGLMMLTGRGGLLNGKTLENKNTNLSSEDAKFPAFESPHLKTKIKGLVFSNIEVENFRNGESNHEGRLEFDTERFQDFEAEFELRARTKESEVNVREALINRKLSKGWRLEFGYGKKIFGLESELGRRERLTVERSPIYRRLEVFTYNAREGYIRLYRELNRDKDRSGFSMIAGQSEADSTNLIGSFHFALSDDWTSYTYLLMQSRKIQEGRQANGALAQAFAWQQTAHSVQFEVHAGTDPDESELLSLTSDDKKIYYGAVTSQYAYRWRTDDYEAWEPLTQLSYINLDFEEPGYNTVQALLGINYYLLPLKLALNVEMIGTTSRLDTSARAYDESNARFEASFEF